MEGTTYREAIANIWSNAEIDDVDSIMADIDQRYNDALQKADQTVVALYALKDGVTPEKSK